MFVPVEWMDENGWHVGDLTDQIEDIDHDPMIVDGNGRNYTARELRGFAVTALPPRSRAAEDLVARARADGFRIEWK